jgi:hypothetical protein
VTVTGPKALSVEWNCGDATLHHAVGFGPTSAPAPVAEFLIAEGEAAGPWFRLWLDQ